MLRKEELGAGQSPSNSCYFCRQQASEHEKLRRGSAAGAWDDFPVAPGHFQVFPTRHVQSYFDLKPAELIDMQHIAIEMAQGLHRKIAPDAFTIGVNDGPASGQTVPHVHMHVIPRWFGDVESPAGGLRRLLRPNDDWTSSFRAAATSAAGPRVARCRFCDPVEPWRVFRQTASFRVFAGLGPVEPGYVLVVARDHFGSARELPESKRTEFVELVAEMQALQRSAYGRSVIFEHGRNGGCLPGGHGDDHCYHAHVHLAATSCDLLERAQIDYHFEGLGDWSGLWNGRGTSDNSYLLVEGRDGLYVHFDPANLPKRYLRSVWAELAHGDAGLSDWEAFPSYASIRETLSTLVSRAVGDAS